MGINSLGLLLEPSYGRTLIPPPFASYGGYSCNNVSPFSLFWVSESAPPQYSPKVWDALMKKMTVSEQQITSGEAPIMLVKQEP